MKKSFLVGGIFAAILFGSVAIAASPGNIDPQGIGAYKAAFLDTSVVADTSINFGKFTNEAQYDIVVSDTELRGYAWGSSVGYIVMNCADTPSGCTTTNGGFKVKNDGSGLLSGYAWGDNTGWINFGPFTNPSIITVKIDNNTGNFAGTSGTRGYAWTQSYGWIVFDCTQPATCVNTSWRIPVTQPVSGGGGGGGTGGTTGPTIPPTGPTQPPTQPPAKPPTNPPSNQPSTPPNTTPPSQPGNNNPPQNPNQPSTPPPSNQSPNAPTSPSNGNFLNNGLPPALAEALNNIVSSIGNAANALKDAGLAAAKNVLNAARTPAGTLTSKIVTAIGIVTTAAAGSAVLFLANPAMLPELFLLPFRLWTLILVAFGIKKRNRPWGTVYDSVTKQPIDPAYVMLMDMQGNEVATSITDINGRYGFSVVPGTYKIVANKTNFTFPSAKLAGHSLDELYSALYFGDAIVVKEEGEIIAKNIPLDQQNFDWNEFAKDEQHRLSYYRHSDVVIARIANVFFWLGFAISSISLVASHSVYNGAIFVMYVIIFAVRHYSPQFKTKGAVTEALTDQPMPFAIIHVLSAATSQEITHKVADRLGNYYCLVPNGTYNIVIDRKNPDATYTKIPVPEPVVVKNGSLQQSFAI